VLGEQAVFAQQLMASRRVLALRDQVIGLEALKTAMASDQRTAQIPGRPTVTFAKDYVLKFGGAEVQAHHYGRGHTIDDTIVYFPDAKVVMVSDQITDGAPLALFAEGGSIVEWRQSLEAVLKLDFDTAIPGRGDPRPKAAIQAYKEKWDTVISRVNDAIKAAPRKISWPLRSSWTTSGGSSMRRCWAACTTN